MCVYFFPQQQAFQVTMAVMECWSWSCRYLVAILTHVGDTHRGKITLLAPLFRRRISFVFVPCSCLQNGLHHKQAKLVTRAFPPFSLKRDAFRSLMMEIGNLKSSLNSSQQPVLPDAGLRKSTSFPDNRAHTIKMSSYRFPRCERTFCRLKSSLSTEPDESLIAH